MKINTKSSIALLTGGVLAASAIALPAAHAAESKKEKQFKTGAVILGALGAYFVVKGKTVPAVVAGAGAYYAYKKSKDERNEYSYRDNDDRYAQSTSRRNTQRENADIGYESDARYENSSDDARNRNDDLGYDALTSKPSSTEKVADTKVVEKTSRAKAVVID